jgi:23S rRNA A2030 N6-methylase RlmJ
MFLMNSHGLKFFISQHFVFIVFLFGIMACAGPSQQMEQYDASLRSYEQALRWQDYDLLVSFHKNEYKTLTKAKRKRLKQYRVTSYNVISNVMAPDQRHATQIVEIKYYNTDYQVVHDMTLRNRWEYDPKSNHWYLLNPLPDFK